MSKGVKAVFVDRDGTLITDLNYLTDPRRIQFYKNVYKGLKLLRKAGYKIIMTTNQSGIGRNYLTRARLNQIHIRFNRILRKNNTKIDGIYYCPHLPEKQCSCRKPRIGMVQRARRDFNIDLSRSFVIGDKSADVHMAWNFGGKGILILSGKGRRERPRCQPKKLYHVSLTFYHAVCWMLKSE